MIHQGHPYWSLDYGHTVAMETSERTIAKMLVYPQSDWPRVLYVETRDLQAMPLRYLHDQLP